MDYLDTNVFLRYVTQPDLSEAHLARQSELAKAIFEQIEAGTLVVATCEGVIVVEIVQVLSSRALYNVPRAEIQRLLSPLLRLAGVKLANKRSYFRALDLYVEHPRLDFVDALNVAHMERQSITTILSFDRDFDHVPGVSRKERASEDGSAW